MAIRNFGSRKSGARRKDPVQLASHAPSAPVNIVKANVKANRQQDAQQEDPSLTIVENEDGGQDPYNSTGRFMVEKLRKLGLDE